MNRSRYLLRPFEAVSTCPLLAQSRAGSKNAQEEARQDQESRRASSGLVPSGTGHDQTLHKAADVRGVAGFDAAGAQSLTAVEGSKQDDGRKRTTKAGAH